MPVCMCVPVGARMIMRVVVGTWCERQTIGGDWCAGIYKSGGIQRRRRKRWKSVCRRIRCRWRQAGCHRGAVTMRSEV